MRLPFLHVYGWKEHLFYFYWVLLMNGFTFWVNKHRAQVRLTEIKEISKWSQQKGKLYLYICDFKIIIIYVIGLFALCFVEIFLWNTYIYLNTHCFNLLSLCLFDITTWIIGNWEAFVVPTTCISLYIQIKSTLYKYET